jgi:hypothetical protein
VTPRNGNELLLGGEFHGRGYMLDGDGRPSNRTLGMRFICLCAASQAKMRWAVIEVLAVRIGDITVTSGMPKPGPTSIVEDGQALSLCRTGTETPSPCLGRSTGAGGLRLWLADLAPPDGCIRLPVFLA